MTNPAVLQLNDDSPRSVCETLRRALPGFDALMSTIATKGFWWNSFRQKTRAITHSPVEGLIALATSNYTSEKPADVGLLVVAYARCLNDGKDLYALVEKLVISNLTYLASVEGMECLVLLAKSYTDMGQPRRAWLMWRRGLTIAQFLVGWLSLVRGMIFTMMAAYQFMY